jgi:hypothetical protein
VSPRSSVVTIVEISKWFPPDDPLAAKIARLCILREDFLLEMQGVYREDIAELDENSAKFRRQYFLRNLFRTQMEMAAAIQTLLPNPEFKALLEMQSDEVKKEFAKAVEAIGEAHPYLKDVRNDVGGHVLEAAVQAALERIKANSPDTFGLFDIGLIQGVTHYKFIDEVTSEMLLKDVSEQERRDITSSKLANACPPSSKKGGAFVEDRSGLAIAAAL